MDEIDTLLYGNLISSYLIDAMDGNYVITSQQSHTSDGNHVATKTDARGKVVTYTTDLAKDTLTRVTDPNGQSVNYTYDALKRVTGTSATVDGNTYKNTYTYENDRIKTVAHNTTGNTPDVTYTFDYDRFGNPTTVKVGTQTLSTNVYTTTGDRTLMRVEYGNGGKVHYTRDDFRRVTGIHYDAATAPRFTYNYGANGQVAYVRDNELNRTVWMEYDTSERPIRSHLLEGSNNASIGTPKYTNRLAYDEFGNVSEFVESINNEKSYETFFSYDVENRPTELMFNEPDRELFYSYDPIGRIRTRKAQGWNTEYLTTYQYLAPENSDGITTTSLVESITQNGQNFSYTYDSVGNIASVTRNGLTTTYAHDNLGQLIRVNDPHANKSTVYMYDRGGNMTSYSEYAYTTGALGTATQTVSYVYGDTNWKDKVTAIGGKAITYDAIGNPLTYDGWTFTWKAGRMLASMVKTGTNAQFTYDHNGLRIRKAVNGVTTSYTLNGKNIVHMTQGSNDLHFFYDAQDKPAMVRFNGTDYFYVYNLRGDVVAMIDANGTQVVEYYYDAWGAPISKTGTMAATLGTVNPFRYRGYVYDEETGLYYLRSRYYNPVWKRFINADIIISAMGRLLTCNPFVYCWSNPTGFVDSDGSWGKAFKSTTVYGVTVSGTVGMYTATYSRGFAYDTEKNVAVYESVSGLPIAGSDETVLAFDVGVASSLSVFYQVLPGKTVDEIDNAGSFVGVNIGPLSIDAVMLCRMVEKDPVTQKTIPNEEFDGLQLAFGVSKGLDLAHFGDSFTTLTYILKKGKIVDKNALKADKNYRPSLLEFLLNDVFKIR